MAIEELEEITYLSRASRSLLMMAVEPSVASAAMIWEVPGLEKIFKFRSPTFWSWRTGWTMLKNMIETTTISAFYSRTISKSITNLIIVLIKSSYRFSMRGADSGKSCIKLRSFIQIEMRFFKDNLLDSSIQWWKWIRCSREAHTTSYSGRRAMRTWMRWRWS